MQKGGLDGENAQDPPAAALLDVPVDVLRQIAELLGSTDLACLARACKLLQGIATLDAVWEAQCQRFLDRNGAGVSAAQLAQCLQLGPRALYQVLHRLGGWPCGLWHATDDSGQGPRGRLVLVTIADGSLLLQQVECQLGQLGQLPASVQVTCDELVRLRPQDNGPDILLVAVSRHPQLPPIRALALSNDGSQLTLLRGSKSISLMAVTGQHRVVPFMEEGGASSSSSTPTTPPYSPRAWGGTLFGRAGWRPQDPGNWAFNRVTFSRLLPPPAGDPPGVAMLAKLQGLWKAVYSVHGFEVLLLSVREGTPAPPNSPFLGPRLEGLKLLGDPNVPASKHSFVVDAASCRLGRYSVEEDDPFPEQGAARPIISLLGGGVAILIHMNERPVVARFRAVGQINHVPGTWHPEWTVATLVVYEGSQMFSVIFEDEGEPFRHVMDFTLFALQPPGSALWQGPDGERWAVSWQEHTVRSGREAQESVQ